MSTLATMTRSDWEDTFLHLMQPIVAFAVPSRARVPLPGGRSSSNGPGSDSLEAFARSLWMAGPWLSAHPTGEAVIGEGRVNVADLYREGIVNGTDPGHIDSWYHLSSVGQTIVEAASIAWNLWLARAWLWEPLAADERARVLAWLDEVARSPVPDNNWRLFSVIVLTVSKVLSGRGDQSVIDAHLDRIESFYVGDGWYSDGPASGNRPWSFDLYNAFVLHPYLLYWCLLDGNSQPDRRGRIVERASEFQHAFVHWFGSDGSFPCFGRSTLYRMAVTHVFAAAVLADACPLPLGQARRLCGRVLRRAIRWDGAIGATGQLTMGFAREYLPMLEPYSGPGSPYWAGMAFGVLALPSEHPFWTAPEAPLPVERGDFTLSLPAAGFLVRGDRPSGHVQIANGKSVVSAKKYSNLAYSTHFGYEIDRHGPPGIVDPFGEAALTLSRDGRSWYGRRAVRFTEIRESVLVTEAEYRLGGWRLARVASNLARSRPLSSARSRSRPRRVRARARSLARSLARTIYLRLAPMIAPRAIVRTAVAFVGDRQIRAHTIRTSIGVFVREGGYACGWGAEGDAEMRGGRTSYVRTRDAASGIRPLLGYELAPIPSRADHNVLFPNSAVPYVRTARKRRGVINTASVSLARPRPFPAEEIGDQIDGMTVGTPRGIRGRLARRRWGRAAEDVPRSIVIEVLRSIGADGS